MRKKYLNSLLVLFFGLLFNLSINAQVNANNDQGSVVQSSNVQIAIQNVLGNDTLNGIPVTLSDVTISQVSATSANVFVQPNGNVVVNGGSSSGSYVVTYQICSNSVPTNCDTASAFVSVTPPPSVIVAGPDSATISSGAIAPQIVIENILSNDTLNGIPITINQVSLFSQVSSTAANYFNIDSATGNVNLIGSGVPPGVYEINYYYCRNTSPFNCVSGVVTITVINSLLTTINGTYQDLNGDGVTSVGDVVNYTFSTTNIGSNPVSNVDITSSEANINGGPPIPLLNPGANNNSTFTGIHVITQADINAGQVVVTIQTNGILLGNPISVYATHSLNLNIANGIKLNAFVDYNSNGVQDGGEPNFTHGSFQYELNNNGTTHNISSSNGVHYLYETNPANSFDFGYTIDPAYISQYTVTPASYANITVPNGSGVVTYNFAVTQIPFNDLSVVIYGGVPPRPGFIYYNYVYYTNNGNLTIPSGTITFNNSNVVTITSAPAGSVPFAGGFTYNFTNLAPGQWGSLMVAMQVPTIPTVNLGDLITNTASASVPTNDINVLNNSSSLTQAIVGSYDPNDKAESHGPQILHSAFTTNDYLTYTIRFENTGTAEAINIRVEDVLDAQLDENTVRMVAASHAYVLDRVGSNLTWRFNGINLEPSIPGNPTIGHGYIVFQVKPKPGFSIGDIIPNTASIYFDFNPPIVTNTWQSEFVNQLGTESFAFENFIYYPNPVKNNLVFLNSSVIDTIEITSVLGQKAKSAPVNSLQAEIDLSGLNKGLYFVKVTSSGQEKTVKIIKD